MEFVFAYGANMSSAVLRRRGAVDGVLCGIAGALPSPLDELWAVCHFKVIVVDDTAILTGANLSDEYFHCRQARVCVVEDRAFADLLAGIVDVVADHSVRVSPHDRRRSPLLPPAAVGARVVAFVDAAPTSTLPPSANTVSITPLFQHPHCGVAQERAVLRTLLSSTRGTLHIHTPYTNFPTDYVDALRARLSTSTRPTHLTVASPLSHSFTTGRGLKALVPGFYAEREQTVLRRLGVCAAALRIRHYLRSGWVFHSKGMWLDDDDAQTTTTLIGSSSFGLRSVLRDFDLSFLLVSADAALRGAWRDELSVVAAHETAHTSGAHWSGGVTSPIVRTFM
jgi:phosphatidylserine/phosphatidylglycerophosphate/cardiolipin synthase-like enzyme